ncbi:transcriptional regulator [Longimycelium tulufanense]|uniref:Transcriptional regulator n=2 Tax=Longimycelium tulufanense TaxID=907463 RepID=A0A8J3C9D0_9PSEU|nr:transcriptional regulator [Longimycelium tulufanense]
MEIEDVRAALGMSRAKLYRIESPDSAITVSIPDVIALCHVYGASAHVQAQLVEMARHRDGWWTAYQSGLTGWFVDYVMLEAEASEFFEFAIDAVPGLLQTEDYAREVIAAWTPEADASAIDARVAARMERQRRLTDGLAVTAVVDEYALVRPTGSSKQMRGQLERLLDLAKQPNVKLHVLPTTSGAHAALTSPFNMLHFRNMPPIVYVDTLSGGLYVDDERDVERYEAVADQLLTRSLSAAKSRKLIERCLEDLRA